MSEWLIEKWFGLPWWMRALVGLELIGLGTALYLKAQALGPMFEGGQAGGFVIGFGIAVVMCCMRGSVGNVKKDMEGDAA